LVFFTSDNGPWLIQRLSGGSSGPFFEGKTTTWEGGIREPGMARWPGKIKPGSINREMVATYDIFSTIVKLGGAKVPQDRVIDGRDLTDVLTRGAKSQHRCLFHYKGTPSTGLPPKVDDAQPGLWAIRCGSYKAHFVTSCAVMQNYGDSRCSSSAAQPSAAQHRLLFEECQNGATLDECALELSSAPTIHASPVVYNVEHDPSEMYPLDSSSSDYKAAMAEILEAKRVHEATLTPVPNQIGMGMDLKLAVCCKKHHDPIRLSWDCTCNPENYHPAEGVCSPVYDPTVAVSVDRAGSTVV